MKDRKDSESNSTTYNDDNYNCDIGGNVSSDVARANWGGSWCLPTPSLATSFAFSLRFDSDVHTVDDLRRRDGMSVRPPIP